eukprot:12151775-Alexandrium_andersonii.AAC.1
MYAGTAGKGAEEAWMECSLGTELAIVGGSQLELAAIDLMKAFDTIPRAVLYSVLLAAGFPSRLYVAYRDYHEAIVIHHRIHGVYGMAHTRARSIPQGCPWSMMFCALLLRPVVQIAQREMAIPRILADDLMVMAHGEGAQHVIDGVVGNVEHFFEALAMKVQRRKCVRLSTCKQARKHFRMRARKVAGVEHMAMANAVRDLGAQLS